MLISSLHRRRRPRRSRHQSRHRDDAVRPAVYPRPQCNSKLAAAGATLQKSGQIAVVGGRTAVAAGRAQKKLVRGKKSAALQKLGHAGRNAMAITTLAR